MHCINFITGNRPLELHKRFPNFTAKYEEGFQPPIIEAPSDPKSFWCKKLDNQLCYSAENRNALPQLVFIRLCLRVSARKPEYPPIIIDRYSVPMGALVHQQLLAHYKHAINSQMPLTHCIEVENGVMQKVPRANIV